MNENTNRYGGNCNYCGSWVPSKAGVLLGKKNGSWRVAHLACKTSRSAQVSEFYFPSTGNRITRNARGLCEDAPCCGCCTG